MSESRTPQNQNLQFLFPETKSKVLPDPYRFYPKSLLSTPLPTNSFFQNFALRNGDQPEYIHPYLIKSSLSSLSLTYPFLFSNKKFLYQVTTPDITISSLHKADPHPYKSHIISSFNDLSVTLDLPSSKLRFFLVRGSPYLTFSASGGTGLSIETVHAVVSFTSNNNSNTKYTIKLSNSQTWLVYSSSPIKFNHDRSLITSGGFSGIIRIAVLPDPRHEAVLDKFSSCYPVSGDAVFTNPFCLEYKWEKKGNGGLLLLAHPLHLRFLSADNGGVTILERFKYRSIDGGLVGVVGDSWALRPDPVSVTWHSIRGIKEESYPEIISALLKDVKALDSKSINKNSYFYGKLIARAARLALIAEEVCFLEVIPAITKYLKNAIEPWLNGTFRENGFVFDKKYGGLITKNGSSDSGKDFGFGLYNDHHYHLGYFIYATAVLAKIDPKWGEKYKPQAYSFMLDFMNLERPSDSCYTRLRCFDLWKLHSWAGGLTEFTDGRNQESTSEAVNAYYSAALLGLAYGDSHLVDTGSMLAAMEIQAANTWWHVKKGRDSAMYGDGFTRENRVVGVLWSNKRDSGLWFASPDWKECRLGIQVLPILPITEVLFADIGFVKDLVNWALPALKRNGVKEGWKGFVYALQGIYDKEGALCKIKSLKGFDDGNSLTNLLWWIHSRNDDEIVGEVRDAGVETRSGVILHQNRPDPIGSSWLNFVRALGQYWAVLLGKSIPP